MRSIRVITICMFLLSALAAGAVPAGAAAPKTLLISKSSSGVSGNGGSNIASLSHTGRFVAFESDAQNFGPTGGVTSIFVRDVETGKTRLVSKTSSGIPADGTCYYASISASGRHVVFESDANNLPGEDAWSNVYVHDRKTGRTRLVSRTSAGVPTTGGGSSTGYDRSISDSGRYIVFESRATNLPLGDGEQRIYVRDMVAGKTRLVSKTSGGVPSDDYSQSPVISSSGRYVVFQSDADNLPGEDAWTNVYVHDLETGRTRLASRTSAGVPITGGGSGSPTISGTGRFVAFESSATNLPGGGGGNRVFLHDRRTGKTRLISRTKAGAPAGGTLPSMSASGRHIAFQSSDDDLPGLDGTEDSFLYDRKTRRVVLVSRTTSGAPTTHGGGEPAVSGDGRFVAFHTVPDNLPGNQLYTNVYRRGPLG